MSDSNKSNSDTYFASEDAEKVVAFLERRTNLWLQSNRTSEYIDKIKRSWQYYHGIFYEQNHSVGFAGEQGELVTLGVNHYANIAQTTLTMVTASRPSFQARAINTDLKSQIQTNLAGGLLDFYMRDKRLEQDLKKAVEYAIVLGTGYIKMEWNATAGRIVETIEGEYETSFNEETQQEEVHLDEKGEPKWAVEPTPIYEGDVEFKVLSPLDVFFDTSKEDAKHDWVLCRTFKNKFDIAAKYPELAEEIKGVQTKSEQYAYRLSMTPYDETVDVPVYEFFHKPTESMPKGRYVLYLNSDVILVDDFIPYQNLPLFRISPRDILGTSFGYTNMFDCLGPQEQLNALYSAAATNNHQFGVQSIVVQRDSGITKSELEGGLNIIEVNDMNSAPKPLQLTQSAPELYQMMDRIVRDMEYITGMNSVARGQPDPQQNLRSGNALALVQAQALQYISGLQQGYIQLIEDVGTNLILLLQRFADVPRIAQISGKGNITKMQEFTGADIGDVNRVVVDAGNALMQSAAGKLEVAQNLMQMGLITTPQDYISVLTTGNLKDMTDPIEDENEQIKSENEDLLEGKISPVAILTDDHMLHIKKHRTVLSDSKLRRDSALVDRVLAHIQEHMNILSNPNVANQLVAFGQTPIAPPMMPQQMPGQPAPEGPGAAPVQENPQAQSVQAPMGDLPQPATPPELDVPQTGAEMFNNLVGGGGQ